MLFLYQILFAGSCLAQNPDFVPRAIPPHLKGRNPKFFEHRSSVRGEVGPGFGRMKTTILSEAENSMDVTISWEGAPQREIGRSDWIGAFDQELLYQFHAPVKFRYVFPMHSTSYKNYGSMNFTVWNFRSSYVFIYISGNAQYPSVIAQSEVLDFTSTTHPMAFHIALSPTRPNTMLVMWNQKNASQPKLKWGLSADSLDNSVNAATDTYTRDDFCDGPVSTASRQGWFEPGYFLKAEVPVVPGQTYYYSCGDSTGLQSRVRNFTVPPTGSSGPTRLILFADLGNAPLDGSLHHSWDFHNQGELPSRNTTRLSKHLLDKENAHAVVHFGDIAYAVGYLSEWDEFMQQIEPVASRIPWMASIGNHEMGWSQSDPFNGTLRTDMDSGGECGVAFLKRFPYAMQPLASGMPWRQALPWYSFNIGAVHFTMLSSEHDFRTGSPQWLWMVEDFKHVDRSSTPWLVVTSHRAMYIASDYDGDQSVAQLLRQHVEPQLLQYGVDFFLSGHHHSYQRFCKLNNGKCVGDGENIHGINHFIMGMAGYDHSPVGKNFSFAQFTDETFWGVTYWEFDQTSATMKYIDGATDETIDSFSFNKSTSEANLIAFV